MKTTTLLLSLVALSASADAASAQMKAYCIEGAKFTCFGLEYSTTPSANGTLVTVRIRNLQGASLSGVTTQVAWSRLYHVEFVAPAEGFTGGVVTDRDPAVSIVAPAQAVGGAQWRWFALEVGEIGGPTVGYALDTPIHEGGAEVIGCNPPPDEGYVYVQTCGDGALELKFETLGQWQANELGVVVGLQDEYADDMSCLIAGARYDEPDSYHCADYTNGAPLPTQKPTATLSLNGLAQTYDGTPRVVTVTTSPEGVAGASVTYDGNLTPPINAGSYAVAATLTSETYTATPVSGSLVVSPLNQAITFTGVPPAVAVLGTSLSIAAVGGGSGNPVLFSSLTPATCAVDAGATPGTGRVTLNGIGTCTVGADQAGNSPNYMVAPRNSISVNAIWPFAGFKAPVQMEPTVNATVAGQTIPVKFSLGGARGLSIFETGYPRSTALTSCGTASTVVGESVASNSEGLSYDATADQYIYRWRAERSWAGQCRQLIVRLIDGTQHTATFSFR